MLKYFETLVLYRDVTIFFFRNKCIRNNKTLVLPIALPIYYKDLTIHTPKNVHITRPPLPLKRPLWRSDMRTSGVQKLHRKLIYIAIQHQKCYNFYLDNFFLQSLFFLDRAFSAQRALFKKDDWCTHRHWLPPADRSNIIYV